MSTRSGLAQIWRARHLITGLAARDLKLAFRDRALGMMWSLLDPLLMLGVYIALIAVFLDRGGPLFPVLLSALVSWQWFSFSLKSAVVSVARQGRIIQSIHFPLLALPLSKVLVGLARYGFASVLLVVAMALFEVPWGWHLGWFPLIVLIQAGLTAGAAVLVALLGVFFRDLENLLAFVLRMGFYLSPGLYEVRDVPAAWRTVYQLNPFAGLFEAYKQVLVYGQPPPPSLAISLGFALLFGALGLYLFGRAAPAMAKAV